MKLDLSSKSELDWLAHLLADVESAVPGLNPLLVGAQARDLLLHYGHGIEIERGTADVDFAIAVDDWSRFSAARTLAGRTHLALLQRRNTRGYRIEIVFLRIESSRLALRRIAARVREGGHVPFLGPAPGEEFALRQSKQDCENPGSRASEEQLGQRIECPAAAFRCRRFHP